MRGTSVPVMRRTSRMATSEVFITIRRNEQRNIAVITILSVAAIMLFSIISIPTLRHTFSFEFSGYQHFATSICWSRHNALDSGVSQVAKTKATSLYLS